MKETTLFRVGRQTQAFCDFPAPAEHDDPVRDFEDVVHVVTDEDHGPSAAGETPDQLQHLSRLGHRERGGRLVHDNEARIEIEGARNGDRLTLSAGEAAYRRVRVRDMRVKVAQEFGDTLLHLAPA